MLRSEQSTMPQDYNATINLPKTDFPMRAGLPKREPEMLQRWKKLDVYGELLKKNAGKPRFSLHDGPPFSNGNLHMGHALNKSIKDIIVRSPPPCGGTVPPMSPGGDNHGMPIESAIIKQNKLNRKTMPSPSSARPATSLPSTMWTCRARASSAWGPWGTGRTPTSP